MGNNSSKTNKTSNTGLYNFLIICVVVAGMFMLRVQPVIAQESTEAVDFDTIHTQFDSKQNWADDDTKKLFKFIYYNIPDWHKEKALKAFQTEFSEERNDISREKLLEITDAIMPDKAHEKVQYIIDEAIGKVVSYQDSVKKSR